MDILSTDRCDRCGAQAYVQVSRETSTLMFCNHDFNKHSEALDKDGWSISIDERDLLIRKTVEVG